MKSLGIDKKLLIICIVVFLNAVGDGAVTPIIPLYVRDFNVQYTIVGFVVAAFGLARFFMNIPTGKLVDKFGRKPIIISGFALRSFSAILFMISPNIFFLFISSLIQGFSTALAMIACMVYVGDIAPKTKRGRYMSYYQASFFGSSLGMIIGGLAVEKTGYNSAFIIMAILTLLGAVFSALFIKDSAKKPKEKAISTKPISVKSLLSRRDFLLVSFAGIILSLLLVGIKHTMLPLYSREKIGLLTGNIGILLSISSVFSFLMLIFVTGRIIDRIGHRTPLFLGLLTGSISCYGFAFSNNFITLGIYSVFLGISMGLITPSITSFIVNISTSNRRGFYMGIYRCFYDFGGLIAPLTVGFLLDAYELTTPFLFISFTCLVMGASTILLFRKKLI